MSKSLVLKDLVTHLCILSLWIYMVLSRGPINKQTRTYRPPVCAVSCFKLRFYHGGHHRVGQLLHKLRNFWPLHYTVLKYLLLTYVCKLCAIVKLFTKLEICYFNVLQLKMDCMAAEETVSLLYLFLVVCK